MTTALLTRPRRSEHFREYFPLFVIALANLGIHLATNGIWGFHRDELLYLAMGRHPDWGYWSNPPLIGAAGWLAQHFGEVTPWTVRLIPSLLNTALVILTGLIAREMGGGRAAVMMAALSVLLSPAFLRTGMLFQPVVFDIFFWTLCAYLIVRYLNSGRTSWLWWTGVAVGLGLLNKYSIAFLVLGILCGLALTPHRSLFRGRILYGSMGLALLIILPNLIWQAAHDFPVFTHMQELRETQLVNVEPVTFLLEQLLLHLPIAPVWILGLVFLFGARGKPYRILAWIFVAVLLLLLALGGKSYYTLGLYPMLLAAGAVRLEQGVRTAARVALFAVATGVAAATSPIALPFLSVQAMVDYGTQFREVTGVDAFLRWEDGETHPLPQDFADMLGWKELAGHVARAYTAAPEGALIYCENYGQAGAVTHYVTREGGPEPISFSDSYVLWAPRSLEAGVNALIYVNDEMGDDVKTLFADITVVGTVDTPYARERGTMVYLCKSPRVSLPGFWRDRVEALPAAN